MQVYKTINLINNKIYVGKDCCCKNDYLGSGKLIKMAINKYGKENFKKEIIEDNISDKQLLCEREKFWIKQLKSQSPNGYNIASGGEGGDTLSRHPNYNNIIKKKIESAVTNNNYGMRNKYHNEKTKEKLKQKALERSKNIKYKKMISEKTKEAMKRLNVQNKQKESQLKRFEDVKEKEKISNSMKNYHNSAKGKKQKEYLRDFYANEINKNSLRIEIKFSLLKNKIINSIHYCGV